MWIRITGNLESEIEYICIPEEENKKNRVDIKSLRALLSTASCPECDGTGMVNVGTGEMWKRGDGLTFAVTEPIPCVWCVEKKRVLKSE